MDEEKEPENPQKPWPRPRPPKNLNPRPLGSPIPGALRGFPSSVPPSEPVASGVPKRLEPEKSSKEAFTFSAAIILFVAIAYGVLVFMSKNTIAVDGKTIQHYSFSKGTVRDLLKLYQINPGEKDLVTPPPDSPVRWGQKIQVVRVVDKIDKMQDVVDFVLRSKSRSTNNLRKIEVQRGYREVKTWYATHVLHDDKEVAVKNTPKIVNRIPVDRVVFLSSRDQPEKIYDLSKSASIDVLATAYWKGDPQVPGVITYSGHKVQRGLVAVDPKTIPLGWRLYIPGYGYAYSSDTGSKIKGRRIDLFVESKKISRQWEYKKVTVYLLEKSKSW